MSKWKPIETAPKDGTLIDVWAEPEGRITDVSWVEFFSKEGWYKMEDHHLYIEEGFLSGYKITYWMPVPEFPPFPKE